MKTRMHSWKISSVMVLSAAGMSACNGPLGTDCSVYVDEKPLGKVTFAVKNNQTVQTYLDLGACAGSFAVQAPGAMSRQAENGIFEQRCEDLLKGGHLALDCNVARVVAIKPGDTYNLQWNGLVYEELPMVNECYEPARPSEPSSSPSATCWSSRPPEAGTLQGIIKLYRSASCEIYTGCSYEMDPYTVVSPSFNYPGDTQVQVEVN